MFRIVADPNQQYYGGQQGGYPPPQAGFAPPPQPGYPQPAGYGGGMNVLFYKFYQWLDCESNSIDVHSEIVWYFTIKHSLYVISENNLTKNNIEL